MSDAYIVRRGGGAGGIDPANAVIHVTAQAGSTITFAKGGVTAATIGPDKQHINAADSDKADWYYPVRPANFGEWDVTATLTGTGTGTYTVTVSEAKAYDVDVSLGYLIFRNGWQHGYQMEAITNFTQNSYTINNDTNPASVTNVRYSFGFKLNKTIDVTNYSTLYVEFESDWTQNYLGVIGLWDPANTNATKYTDGHSGADVYYEHKNGGSGDPAIPRGVYQLDISGLSGERVFKAQQKADTVYSITGRMFLYDMYMT